MLKQNFGFKIINKMYNDVEILVIYCSTKKCVKSDTNMFGMNSKEVLNAPKCDIFREYYKL